MKVANRRCIRHVSMENMKAARFRNAIAISAIALTTILFTVLFTVLMTLSDGYEQMNFRQIGSCSHAGIKFLTLEQFDEIKSDPLIKEYGMRQYVGLATKEPFHKNQVEVSYCDSNMAKWYYLNPSEGKLPSEGTNEIATDTEVLSLLGIKPEIGAKVKLTFMVENEEVTENFVLSGWWEADPVAPANHVLLSRSMAEEILSSVTLYGYDNATGKYALGIMFGSASHIEDNLKTVVERNGYSMEDRLAKNYISAGYNFGYLNTDVLDSVDWQAILAIIGILLLIILIGYLIIYNVFRISVAGSIRHYGLLKTIGTTGKQIKYMIRIEALTLSLVGIFFGLLIGYLLSVMLTPVVFSALTINELYNHAPSANPVIFVGSAIFSLVTVFLSVRKPGKMAAKVSPMEALRFTEGNAMRRKRKKGKHGASVCSMAFANLGRSRSRTAVTMVSMCLSLVLLNLTFIMANSFDIEEYIGDLLADFVVSDAGMMNGAAAGMEQFPVLSQEVVKAMNEQGNIAQAGKVYACKRAAYQFMTEERYISGYSTDNPEDVVRNIMELEPHKDGLVGDMIELYGMEPFCIDKLNVLTGDIAKLSEQAEDKNYIAVVCDTLEGAEEEISKLPFKIGDTITIRYGDKMGLIGVESGKIYEKKEDIPSTEGFVERPLQWHDVDYEVAAFVTVPSDMGLRYYGLGDRFLLDAGSFMKETGIDEAVHYLCNMKEGHVDEMEAFLSDYTKKEAPGIYYNSRQQQMDDFNDFYRMFLILGISLSMIIGLVGVLNFLNSIVTGILARRREFAVLQSVGMTGSQLKSMLITEGLFYAVGAVVLALLIFIVGSPIVSVGIKQIFPFLGYHFTVVPILVILPFFAVLGVIVPIAACKVTVKKSVVERLRETE